MVIQTRRNKKGGGGFTLLEMLLVTALLIALMGAIIFNFSSLQRGADLQEGARQFEALVRFAGAQAANSGHAVQLRFDGGASSTNMVEVTDDPDDWSAKLRVVWEPDPVLQPGVFVDLPEAAPFVEAIGDRVRIDKIRLPQRPLNLGTNDLAMTQDAPEKLPSVTFFPDGSSDSAEIVLLSKRAEDSRQATVRVDGITGSVRSELVAMEDLVPVEWMGEENAATNQNTTPPLATDAQAATPVEQDNSVQPVDDFEKPAVENTQTNLFDADFPK